VSPQKRQEPLREGWYRNVSVRMWGDEKFRSLSQDAKFLWLYLLTGPHTTVLPGLFALGKASLAEELGWATDRLVTAFGELESSAMARADWSVRVVWLVNAGKHNRPDNPNVVIAWRNAFVVIPESPVKDEAEKAFMRLLECRGAAYVEAFKSQSWQPLGEPFPKPFGEQLPKQDQDQDQDQQQDQDQKQKQDQPSRRSTRNDVSPVDLSALAMVDPTNQRAKRPSPPAKPGACPPGIPGKKWAGYAPMQRQGYLLWLQWTDHLDGEEYRRANNLRLLTEAEFDDYGSSGKCPPGVSESFWSGLAMIARKSRNG
jgi:hypothetical protein